MSFRFLAAPLLIALAAVAPGVATAATVTLNGAPIEGVVVKDGHLMVPFRAPLEALGAKVGWDDATNIASASYGGAQLVTVTVGSTEATVTGNQRTMSVAPVLENHLCYIPVETLADISHAKVVYSADRQSAAVTGWDLAGINEVGSGGSLIWVWVWILVIGGILYLVAARMVDMQMVTRARA